MEPLWARSERRQQVIGQGRRQVQLMMGLGLQYKLWLLLLVRWAAAGASEQSDMG